MNDPNQDYDRIRCRTCGYPWEIHSYNLPCSRQRPTSLAPAWVEVALANHELAATASNLPPSADDAEIARREAAGGIPPGEFLAAVMARAHEKNGAK